MNNEQDSDLAGGPPIADDDAALFDLDEAFDFLPDEAIYYCRQHRETMVPQLIEMLEETARLGREGIVHDGNAPFFALFLLNEFQAKEALPALLAALRLPAEIVEEIFGDAITEVPSRTLAVLAADRLKELDALIADTSLYQFVRWEAAVAYSRLVKGRRLERSVAVARLHALLKPAMEAVDRVGVAVLVNELVALNANEVRADLEDAVRQQLVDRSICDDPDIAGQLHPDQPEVCPKHEHLAPAEILDTIAELQEWDWPADEIDGIEDGEDWYDDDDEDDFEGEDFDDEDFDDEDFDDEDFDDESDDELDKEFDEEYAPAHWGGRVGLDSDFGPAEPPATVRHEGPRVGRNDPCPCGSGKKYKKCCLRGGDLLD